MSALRQQTRCVGGMKSVWTQWGTSRAAVEKAMKETTSNNAEVKRSEAGNDPWCLHCFPTGSVAFQAFLYVVVIGALCLAALMLLVMAVLVYRMVKIRRKKPYY